MAGKDELLLALSDIDEKYVRCIASMLKEKPVSKWRYIMKKSIKFAVTAAAAVVTVGVIAVAMLLQSGPQTAGVPAGSVSSPAKEPGQKLRLCADLQIGGFTEPTGSFEFALENFLNSAAEKGGPENVEVEVLPGEGVERETALARIRTEIMSGAGPDIFICNCIAPESDTEQALFQFPEKAMRSGTFLPLDDLIAQAQFMEWEKLTSPVMEAGKTEEGQMLLPIAYSFPLTFFHSSEAQPYPAETAWAEVAEGNDSILAASMEPLLSSVFNYRYPGYCYFSYTWKDIADYDREQLLFSEEELLERAGEVLSLSQAESGTSLAHFRGVMDMWIFNTNAISYPEMKELRQDISVFDSVTMVPLYCDQGGAVASVRAFAGINANTESPEDAFFVLDLLMSRNTQEHSELYTDMWSETAWPVHEEISYSMQEETMAAFQEARAQLSGARFYTALDSMMNSVLSQYEMMGEAADETALSDLVSEAYTEMKLVLNES